jgi:hypothetical protein
VTGVQTCALPILSISSFITLPVGAIVAPTAGTQLGGTTVGTVISTGHSTATTVGTLRIYRANMLAIEYYIADQLGQSL